MKKKQRREKKTPRTAEQILQARLRAEGKAVVSTPITERKISDVMLEFSEPLMDVFLSEGRASKRDFECVLQITSIVWNAALLPEGDAYLREVQRAFVSGGAPADIRAQFDEIFDQLVENRRTIYGHDRRLVGDFQVEPGRQGEMRVSFAYRLDPVPL
ncbi:MAG: hypothetical protein KIT58_01605 [Planctomycetota bacterium]|nr:hypothetical protein [Planctomycetota bacterium]